jgi:heterotetrameric sarcosine oxidase delta subunit
MHQLNCPWCGPRAETEFEYLCAASVVASDFASESTEMALQRIFLRDDEIGFHNEIWQHVLGCRSWLQVERHNLTHEVRRVEACRHNGFVRQEEASES